VIRLLTASKNTYNKVGSVNRAFLAGCLLLSITTSGQQQKPGQNQSEDKTDYRIAGTPMPRLKVLLYHDTSKRPTTEAPQANRKTRKRKKEKATALGSQVYLTDKDVNNNANLFVMLFSPSCGHCQDMAKILEANIGSFRKSHLVLVAGPLMRQYLYDFSELTKTYEYPSINIGIDSSGFVDKTFLYQMLPQINIYDRDRKLLKTYTGDIPFDSLKKYIQ
jgi:thiol-disulfide isomerase/thioredoxin